MSMMRESLQRRLSHLENECDILAQAVDSLSAQLEEAYRRLQQFDPAFVAQKLAIAMRSPDFQEASIGRAQLET